MQRVLVHRTFAEGDDHDTLAFRHLEARTHAM
jgi:hypothetical protein